MGFRILPRQLCEQINQSAVTVDRIIAVSVCPPSVDVFCDGNGICPMLVIRREPPVPILLPDGDSQHIQHTLMTELLCDLRDGFPVQGVIVIVEIAFSMASLQAAFALLEAR